MRRLLGIALLFVASAAYAAVFPETPVSAPVYVAATAPQLRLGAAAAAGASSFLVAWEERATLNQPATIVVRALNPDGTPRQPLAVPLGAGQTPAIAWNGATYLVVWANAGRIESERVSEDGVLYPATHSVLAAKAGGRPAIAWNGSAYLVTWGDGAALLDRFGGVVRSVTAGSAVVAAGSNFFMASGAGIRIVAPSGDATEVKPVSTGAVVALSTNGSDVLAVDGKAGFTRLDLSGNIIAWSTAERTAGAATAAAIGSDYIFAQGSTRTTYPPSALYLQRIGTQPATVPLGPASIFEPALASNGTTTILVYTQRTNGVPDAMKIAVAPQWSIPNPDSATTLSITGSAGNAPALALGDNAAIVAWRAPNATSGRVDVLTGGATFAGVALVPKTAGDAANPVDLSVTRGGDRFLIVWADVDPYWREGPVRAAVLDAQRNVVVAPFTIGTGDRPAVAFNGARWLVAWETHSRVSGLSPEIDATLIATDGSATASRPLSSSSNYFQLEPSVAWDGSRFVALWNESIGLVTRDRIVAQTFDANASPLSNAVLLDESLTDPLRNIGVVASGGHVYDFWTRAGTQLFASIDGNAPATIATMPLVISGPRVQPMANGYAAVLMRQGDSSDGMPMTIAFVAPYGAAGSVGLPDTATAWDFAMDGTTAVVTYERDARADEHLGTTAVFVQGFAWRHRAAR